MRNRIGQYKNIKHKKLRERKIKILKQTSDQNLNRFITFLGTETETSLTKQCKKLSRCVCFNTI